VKVNEVPQDKAYFEEGITRDVCYAIDEDGKYTQVLSLGWKPKNQAIELAWDVVYEKLEEVQQQVAKGILSPVAFFMELNVMDIKTLSGYTGISTFKVRRHLKASHFKSIRLHQLEKYAETFNITVAELLDVERIKKSNFRNTTATERV